MTVEGVMSKVLSDLISAAFLGAILYLTLIVYWKRKNRDHPRMGHPSLLQLAAFLLNVLRREGE